MSFNNKVVLVIGGSSGIGAATAISFTKEGALVSIVGRNEAKLKKIFEQCQSIGRKPFIIKADVSRDDEAKSVIDKTIAEYSKIDVLINSAGVHKGGFLDDGSFIAAYDELQKINLRALINITMLAVPYLKITKGNIVNVSGVGSLIVPNKEFTVGCMLKAAVDHFTKGAAKNLGGFGIRVNSVNPGPVKTRILDNSISVDSYWDMFKSWTLLGRISEPVEVADLICFLASDKAKSMTGSICVIDNGMILKN